MKRRRRPRDHATPRAAGRATAASAGRHGQRRSTRHEDLSWCGSSTRPPAIEDRVRGVEERGRARFRSRPRLDHVLLAGCRDDQTSADATIEGRPPTGPSPTTCAGAPRGRRRDRRRPDRRSSPPSARGSSARSPSSRGRPRRAPLRGGATVHSDAAGARPRVQAVDPDGPRARAPFRIGGGLLELDRPAARGGPADCSPTEGPGHLRARVGGVAAAGPGRALTVAAGGRAWSTSTASAKHSTGTSPGPWWGPCGPSPAPFGAGAPRRDPARGALERPGQRPRLRATAHARRPPSASGWSAEIREALEDRAATR